MRRRRRSNERRPQTSSPLSAVRGSEGVRNSSQMTLRRSGVMDECKARTQGDPIVVLSRAPEDAALRRRAAWRLAATPFLVPRRFQGVNDGVRHRGGRSAPSVPGRERRCPTPGWLPGPVGSRPRTTVSDTGVAPGPVVPAGGCRSPFLRSEAVEIVSDIASAPGPRAHQGPFGPVVSRADGSNRRVRTPAHRERRARRAGA